MPRQPQPHYEESRNQWYAYVRGKKKFLCSGRGNYGQALEVLAGLIGGRPAAKKPASIAGSVDAWIDWKGASPWEQAMVASLVEYAGDWPLSRVGSGFLGDYAKWLQRLRKQRVRRDEHGNLVPYTTKPWRQGKRTIRGKVSYARMVLAWCAHPDRGWIKAAPDYPDLPEAPKGHRDVARPKLRNVFEALPKRSQPILRFIVETGARPSEACNLRWDQIDFESGECRLHDSEHKTGDATGADRVIYLSPGALEVIRTQTRTSVYVFLSRLRKPYTPAGLRSILRKRGIAGAYALRHTFAQNVLEQDVGIEVLSRMLGHTKLSTTQIYAQVRDQQARRVAGSLSSPLQPRPHDGQPGPNSAAGSDPRSPGTSQSRSAG